jgi:hypothetical protein
VVFSGGVLFAGVLLDDFLLDGVLAVSKALL